MILMRYPDNWRKLSTEIRQICNWECQVCGVRCRRPGEFYLGWEYEAHVAHWDHDYDSAAIFVVMCCAKCHFRHDAPFVWHARRRAQRWRMRAAGQLEIFAARG